MPARATALAAACVLSAASLWGAGGLVMRHLFDLGVTPLQLVYYSNVCGSLTLLLALALLAPRLLATSPRALVAMLLVGMVGDGFAFWCNGNAIALIGVSQSALLLYSSPAWVTLLAWPLLREPIGRSRVLAILAAYVGCALAAGVTDAGQLQASLVGILFGLGSGFGYALYTVLSKRMLAAQHPLSVVAYTFGGAALALLPFQSAPLPTALPAPAWPWFAAVVLGMQLGGTLLFYVGLRVLPAGPASLLALIQLVVAVLAGTLVLGEPLSALQGVGMLLIAASAAALSAAEPAATAKTSRAAADGGRAAAASPADIA